MRKYIIAVSFIVMAGLKPAVADVLCVQSRLDALGYSTGLPDGVLGNNTNSAAKAYLESVQTKLPKLSRKTSAEWCSELATKTANLPGFMTDVPPGIELFDYTNASFCRVQSILAPPISLVIDRKHKKLISALKWFNSAISTAKARPEEAKIVAEMLEELASFKAFVKLSWRGNGSSPAHWQTNLLKNIAFAVNVVDHHSGWQPGKRSIVVDWGDKVYSNSHYTAWGRKQSQRWPDTIAAAAAAYISWGVVAPNSTALAEGRKDYHKVARLLRKKGGTRSYHGSRKYLKGMPKNWGTRLEDKTLGDLVIAAHVAGRKKIDLFNHAPSGTSLYEAIVGWQNTLFENNGKAVKGEDLSFLATDGEERSWSWTEYFIFNYPNDPRTAILRDKSEKIKKSDWSGFGYRGRATGPSTCLFR